MSGQPPNDIQDITDVIGAYGPWQRTIFIVVFMIGIPSAWNNLVISFFAPPLDYWCARSTEYENLTIEDWKELSIPVTYDTGGQPVYSQCEMYHRADVFHNHSLHNNTTVPCDRWEYDHSFFKSTIIEEWNLVCSNSWLVSLSQSIYMIGYLVAVVVFGQLSDRFGRRPVMLVSIAVLLISGVICSVSPNFIFFSVTRFFIAIGRSGLYVTAFVFLMETVGPTYRPILGMAREYGWATGYVILPGIAWLLRDWSYIQLSISLPVIGFVSMWWLMPESPRWLLTQKRLEEAEVIIQQAVIKNGRKVSDVPEAVKQLSQIIKSGSQKKFQNVTALDLMKTPNMRIKTIIICFNWFVNAFIFYGLSLNSGNIGGDIFLNFFIAGAVEFPAYVLFIFVTRSYGRRIPLLVTMISGGLACVLSIPVPDDLVWIRITLAMIGKFCITASYVIVYIFSAELYPTTVRNVGVGISSTFARIGSVIAPFVKELGYSTHPSVPLGLFGVLSLVGGLLVLLLPETNNKMLPDTLEQGEHFGRNIQPIKRDIEMKNGPLDSIETSTKDEKEN